MALVLLLQGCGKPHGIYADTSEDAVRPASAAAPAAAPVSYIGRWAATAPACAAGAWVFTADRLTTPAGAACDIVGISSSPAGFSASSTCTAPDGAFKASRMVMTLTHTGPAQIPAGDSMTITDSPFGQAVSLVRCPA